MKKGEKVVCVNGDFTRLIRENPIFFEIFHKLPKQYKTYTVREIDTERILLEEIVNPECPFNLGGIEVWDEPGFSSSRFRPLEELFQESENHGTQKIKSPKIRELIPVEFA